MLIMKFNKMIRNKFVWWIIAGIVIVTFVGWFSPRGGCENSSAPTNSAGMLDGKPVSDNELREARFNNYIGLCLSVGRIVNITPKLDQELRDQAWRRIAALRMAKVMNITASPEEILAVISRDPQFQENGLFSRPRYQAFCQNVLRNLNATVTQFEHQLAENIILQKLHGITASAIWMTPDELKTMAARYADSFKLDYISLDTNSLSAHAVKVTDADLRAFYDQNTNRFVVPPKVAVRYIAIPVARYLDKAVEKVDTNALEDYYAAHSDEYVTTDTNGMKTTTPFEGVVNVISNRLLRETAIQLARDAANELSNGLVPDRDGKCLSFDDMAIKANCKITTSPLFTVEGEISDIDAGVAFNTAAFRLRPTSDEYFSDAITGTNHVYLMALSTNTDSYLPEFDQVKDEVRPFAFTKATEEALEKQAHSLRAFFQTGLNNNQSFTALAKEKALTVQTTAVFTASSAPDALSSPEILSDITARNAGEVSEVLPGANGLIIAYVVERKPAADEELSTVKNQVAMSVMRRRARVMFGEWQRSLVGGNRKTDNAPLPERTEEEP